MDIIKKIEEMRVARGWSVYKLSQEAQISQQTFHLWLAGNTVPSIPALKGICSAFGITISELFSENNLIEVSTELQKLYKDWTSLTKEEQSSVKAIIENYTKNK